MQPPGREGLVADEVDPRHLGARTFADIEDQIDAALAEIDARAVQIHDAQLVASARQVAELASAAGLDAKHKLKVAIPIVPVLLTYEAEIEFGAGLNLRAVWRQLTQRSRR